MWKKLREKQRNRQECTTAAAVVRILGGKFLEVHIVNLGKRIREKRLSQNLTQEALAEKADVGTTHISHIETGCTKLSLTTFISIANALDVSADELLCDCINQASNVYETEISLLLKNCSTKEICFIHDLVKNTLISLHNRNLK